MLCQVISQVVGIITGEGKAGRNLRHQSCPVFARPKTSIHRRSAAMLLLRRDKKGSACCIRRRVGHEKRGACIVPVAGESYFALRGYR